MGRKVRVRLAWAPSVLERMARPITQFAKPAKFAHQGGDWAMEAWSLVVVPTGEVDKKGEQSAEAWFLSPDAPQEWLVPAACFELREASLLARGTVLEVLPAS